jgi:hypothetical protein
MKLKAARSSETPEKYQSTRRHIPEYSILRKRPRGNRIVINEEQSIFGQCLLPFGSESISFLSPNKKTKD